MIDIADLPIRMTTSEVCKLARLSKRTFSRRRAQGLLDLEPVDRARELLWRTSDVVRAFNLFDGSESANERPIVQKPSWESPVDAVTLEWVRRHRNPRARPRLTKGLVPPAWFLFPDGRPN